MKTVAATTGALQLALVFTILLRPTSAIIVTRPFIAKNLHHTTAVRMAKEEQPLYKEVINAARIDEKCAARMELNDDSDLSEEEAAKAAMRAALLAGDDPPKKAAAPAPKKAASPS